MLFPVVSKAAIAYLFCTIKSRLVFDYLCGITTQMVKFVH